MTEKLLEERAEPSEPRETQEAISRRHLLRVLAGTGGAVAAWSLLPGRWTRPVVEASLLPRNLQASPRRSTLRIDNLSARLRFTGGRVSTFQGSFDYEDDLSRVSDSATLAASVDPCGQLFFEDTLANLESSISLTWNGTTSSGHIAFPFNTSCVNGANLCVTFKASGRAATACTGMPNVD